MASRAEENYGWAAAFKALAEAARAHHETDQQARTGFPPMTKEEFGAAENGGWAAAFHALAEAAKAHHDAGHQTEEGFRPMSPEEFEEAEKNEMSLRKEHASFLQGLGLGSDSDHTQIESGGTNV